jgi:hypothetical protein
MDELHIGFMKVEVQQTGRQPEGPLNLQKERLMERKLIISATAIFLLVFASFMAPMAGAEDVGSFTQVVKTVDHLKGGKPPAQPAKVDGKVAIKDGVETHADSRAQMKFVDNTTMIVAPKSKVTIEDYMVDRKTGKTQAAMQVFQGLVRTVVPEQSGNPNFLIKTTTSIMGIRG